MLPFTLPREARVSLSGMGNLLSNVTVCGFVSALLLVGCGPDLDAICEDLADDDPVLEVGTGVNGFEAVGAVTGFEFGPQGGLHIYASLRAHGLYGGEEDRLDETLPLLTYTFSSSDGAVSGGFQNQPRTMTALDDGGYERVGDPGILSTDEPSEAEGVDVEIIAVMQDACGRTASSTASTRLSEGAF